MVISLCPCGPLEIKAQTEMTLAVERKTAELEALRDEFGIRILLILLRLIVSK